MVIKKAPSGSAAVVINTCWWYQREHKAVVKCGCAPFPLRAPGGSPAAEERMQRGAGDVTGDERCTEGPNHRDMLGYSLICFLVKSSISSSSPLTLMLFYEMINPAVVEGVYRIFKDTSVHLDFKKLFLVSDEFV